MQNASVRFRIALWLIMLVGGGILGFFLDCLWFPGLCRDIGWHVFSAVPGLILMKLVMASSKTTGRTLARHGRQGDLPRFETNTLVTTGPYGCMRHPMHLGLLFMPLALAMILGSPAFILIIAPLEMIFMVVMIMIFEEREASRKFGEAYTRYRNTVPAFNFRLDCLKKLMKADRAQQVE